MAELSLDNSLLLKQLIPVLDETSLLISVKITNCLFSLPINSFLKQEVKEEKIMVLLSPFFISSLC